MLLLRIWNYIRGYVIICVDGFFIEKFLNLCANKNIYLWDIKRTKRNSMTLKVSIKGFKAMQGISHKTKCKVSILKKVGIPFIKHRYRKRKTFAAGFILFIIIIYVLSSFIWVIEINGLNRVNAQEIVDFLAGYGVKPGILKFRIDKDTIIPNMIIKIEGLSWVDIKQVGTKVIVDVVERVPKPEIIDKSTPCNIYSNNNGVVKQIIAKNGTTLVKEGDVVRRWQLLISGVMSNKLYPDQQRLVHADGEVLATIWHSESAAFDLHQIKREKTGEYKTGLGLKIFNNCYNIYRGHSPYNDFDLQEYDMRLALWKNYELPIQIVTKKYYKVNNNEYDYTEEQAKESAKVQAIENVHKILPENCQVVSTNVEYEKSNDGKTIKAIAICECVENIGYKEKITN